MDMRLVTHTALKDNGCLEWQLHINSSGYGNVRVNGRMKKAHRYAWEQRNGPIPEGKLICHKCDNRRCVNVEHLFLGTHTDNMQDMHAKNRHPKYTFAVNGVHNQAVLSPEEVLEIRARYAKGVRGVGASLAKEYGVAASVISRIVNKKLWSKL
jgi:hypothetical protein